MRPITKAGSGQLECCYNRYGGITSKNWMNSDDSSEPCRCKHQEQCDANHSLGWAILDTPRPSEQPMEDRLDSEEQEQDPPNNAKEDVQSNEARSIINQRDAECKKNPACDIVSNTSSQDSDSDWCSEQVKLCENPAKYRKGSYLGTISYMLFHVK